MPIKCKKARAAYHKQYQIDNREKISAYAKQYQLDNKEKRAVWLLANKDHRAAGQKERHAKNREAHCARMRVNNLKRLYGLEPEDYQLILDAQAGCCPICLKHQTELPKRMAVDHIHDRAGGVDYNKGISTAVRGLLCDRCNRGIGFLGDSIDNILRLLAYKLDSDLCPFTLTKRDTHEED